MLFSIFLFVTLFILQFIIYPFALRFLFRWHQVDFYNPLTQAIIQLTSKPIAYASLLCKATRKFDTPAFLITLILSISIITIKKHTLGSWVTFPSLVILGTLEVFDIFCSLYLIAGLIYGISSFFGIYNANIKVFAQLISGQLNKIRKVFPSSASTALDLSFCIWWVILLSIDYSIGLFIMKL